jgi:uncharacterized membrane protein YphA (DoxX/SURF4 family)
MKKRDKIIYWISTAWLALGMISTGAVQLLQSPKGPGGTESITRLGYPLYFLFILGAWKILGSIAILIPGYALLKEWAYAGFFFIMTGAVISHIASGSTNEMYPAILLLMLTLISWYFRPVSRKTGMSIVQQ